MSAVGAGAGGWIGSVLRLRFLGVVGALLLICAVFSVTADRFLSLGNFRTVLFTAAILAVAVVGVSFVMLTGNLDLSVGAAMGMTAYVSADFAAHHPGIGIMLVLIGPALGALLGLVNGFLVATLSVPSIVATLGTMSIYRGYTYLYAHGQQVTSTQLPSWMLNFADASYLGIPSFVIVAVVVVAIAAAVLRYTTWGRQLYAVGSNSEAARFYGLPTHRLMLTAYVASGAVAGFAGFLYAARVGTVTVVLASGWELQVLAAIVIGGISIWGGSGSVIGAALGAVLLATISNGLVLLGMPDYWQLVIQGVAIVLAVGVDALISRQTARVTTRRRALAAAGVPKSPIQVRSS
ncbi:MAG: transporter permease [Actinomycetia bacterium]|nr:transporter permease [Actinomycetes bacterium]